MDKYKISHTHTHAHNELGFFNQKIIPVVIWLYTYNLCYIDIGNDIDINVNKDIHMDIDVDKDAAIDTDIDKDMVRGMDIDLDTDIDRYIL